MFYFPHRNHATLCSSSFLGYTEHAGCRGAESWRITSEGGNNVLASLSAVPKKCQSLTSLQQPHMHLRPGLSYSVIQCFAWRQRLGSRTEVVPEVPSGVASVCKGPTLPRRLAPAAPPDEGKKHVRCHPIATQAAADSTHGTCVRVHAFKRRGRGGNSPNVWTVSLEIRQK